VYTVSWKVLSAVDGHVTAGAFPFAVGDVDASALATAQQAARRIKLSFGEMAARWLLFLSALTLTGGALFLVAVWQPAYRAVKAEADHLITDRTRWRRLAKIALAVLFAASGLGLLVQAGQAAGGEIAAPWDKAVGQVLFTTRFGALWAARFALTLALAGLLSNARTSRDRWLALGVSLLILLTVSLGSHAAAEAAPLLPIAVDWVHLIAASAWVGGLTHFAAGMWATRALDPGARTRLTARLIPRFSAAALTSVGALIVTGVVASIERVGGWDDLFNSLYGRTLLIKLVIALPMLALGAVNLLVITPRAKRAAAHREGSPGGSVVDHFRRIVASEATLGAALLLSVAVLTSLPPARAAEAASLTASARVDDLSLALDIAPGRVGVNTFTLKVTSGGQPVEGAKEVLLRFTPRAANLPPSEISLVATGRGQYTARGANLAMPDAWQVQAVVRREGKFDAFANFDFNLGGTAASSAQPFAWHRVNGAILLAAAIACAFAGRALARRRSRAQTMAVAALPALALFVSGAYVFYQPLGTSTTGLVNPIPPNTESITIGAALYQAHCLACHGATGKGDGPVGITLNPRPADLSQHAIPGVHTDGQLYEWITNGFPNSVMPAFKDRLTNDERWHLVNYVRTLAPK
jgi:copper transport protein